MSIHLSNNILPIKSIVIYTADLEFELPNKRLEEYGQDITVLGLTNIQDDFVTIEWRNEYDKVKLIKMIAKDEIKCVDILTF